MVMHAKVFAAAVKYQIPALQKLAASKFRRAAQISWNDRSFAEATRIAYTTTSEDIRDIRDIVVKSINEHCSLLDKASVETAIKDIATLNFELLRMARGMPAVAETKVEDESLRCVGCGVGSFYEECQDYLKK
ncbi:hypothetical protein LTR49_027973 [Elasticomyces elasticus]|nr:hypothetical protein LTR49_027973 [Elasticomyces elasticus]